MIASINTRRAYRLGHTSHAVATAVTRFSYRADGSDRVKVRVRWEHALSADENHRRAATAALDAAGVFADGYVLDGFRDDKGVGYWSAWPAIKLNRKR
jgi:hypothetical protein